MDEKPSLEFAQSEHQHDRCTTAWPLIQRQSRSRIRQICLAACIIWTVWIILRSSIAYTSTLGSTTQRKNIGDGLHIIETNNKTRKVLLEAHIMSKCPDAKACLQELVVPAMEKISDKVDFELSYIGR
jgi:hypothetical protein